MKLKKVLLYVLSLSVILLLSFASAGTVSSRAAEKSGVTYSFKDGVLTISGKGDMPSNMTFCDDMDIRKVVVKKGVTGICDSAFFYCINLKTVKLPEGLISIGAHSFAGTNIKTLVIPSSVREIGQQSFWNCKRLKWVTMPGDFKFKYDSYDPDEWIERIMTCKEFGDFAPRKITFTTPLNIENISTLSAKYYVVCDDDPLYSSIDGVIFSKDGTELIRIPSERTSYRVPKTCKKVYISSFGYSAQSEDEFAITKLKKLYLPKGECEIALKTDAEEYFYSEFPSAAIIANKTKLDGHSIELLAIYCGDIIWRDFDPAWFDSLGSLVTIRDDGCVVTHDGMIIRYLGNGGEVTLGNDITGIGSYAFYNTNITSVNIPESVKYIGDYAFSTNLELKSMTIPATVTEFGDNVLSHTSIEKITFEEGIKVIPDLICYNCTELTDVELPSTLEEIGSSAFQYCSKFNIDKYSGFKNMPNLTKIGQLAFHNCSVTAFTIPSTVTEIGGSAFFFNAYDKYPAKITVEGDTAGFHPYAFVGNVFVTYSKGISAAKTLVYMIYMFDESGRKGYSEIGFDWYPISDAYGIEIEISTDENFKKTNKGEASIKDAVVGKDGKTTATVKIEVKSDPDYDWFVDAHVRARLFNELGKKRTYSEWNYLQ